MDSQRLPPKSTRISVEGPNSGKCKFPKLGLSGAPCGALGSPWEPLGSERFAWIPMDSRSSHPNLPEFLLRDLISGKCAFPKLGPSGALCGAPGRPWEPHGAPGFPGLPEDLRGFLRLPWIPMDSQGLPPKSTRIPVEGPNCGNANFF
jgi:hypothetical protein